MRYIPLIGLSTTRTKDEGPLLKGMPKIILNTDYTDVVSKVGGLPIIIPPVNASDEIEIYTDLRFFH